MIMRTRYLRTSLRIITSSIPLYTNYPLIFITGPAERDVNLTISQINTHKIKGREHLRYSGRG